LSRYVANDTLNCTVVSSELGDLAKRARLSQRRKFLILQSEFAVIGPGRNPMESAHGHELIAGTEA
jgi:hypothetical protein